VTVLLVEPGVRWAIADVEAGLRYGLEANGVEVLTGNLDTHWPVPAAVDAVVFVSAIHLEPEAIARIQKAGIPVYVVFTETPYDYAHERATVSLVDGGWTHERAMVDAFRAVNPSIGYLPHGWHPKRHFVGDGDESVPAHDVVFVGSGFPERITFFNAIEWTGIDLGLYGIWEGFGLKESLEPCIKSGPIDNVTAAALYRRAKIGLNLYRRTDQPVESLNPRAYELAACGAFSISEHRAESDERFGLLVPTFRTASEAERLIRSWLQWPVTRQSFQRQLPARVSDASWTERAGVVLADLEHWQRRAA
jgi:spore maturation protein CgeB